MLAVRTEHGAQMNGAALSNREARFNTNDGATILVTLAFLPRAVHNDIETCSDVVDAFSLRYPYPHV